MRRVDPARPLLHPLFWAALALLVVNDHALKGAGVLPGALTGKLSDVAGLVVAPWVLAVLLRATTRRAVVLAHVLVGVGFSAINLSPTCARAVEALTAYTPVPWRITVDPTDLAALPALALSFFVLGEVARRLAGERRLRALQPAWRQAARATTLSLGLAACVATSWEEEGPWRLQPFGSIFVLSEVEDARTITTRGLRAEVALDCPYVALDPPRRLPQELFERALTWTLVPGEPLPLPLDGARGCGALLVGGGGAPPVLLFWRDGELPPLEAIERERLESMPERVLRLEHAEEGDRFGDHPLVHPAPALTTSLPEESCRAPAPGRIAWSENPPEGVLVLDHLQTALDGCHALDLRAVGDEDESERLFLCLNGAPLPFAPGESLHVEETRDAQGTRLVLTGETLVLEVLLGGTLPTALPILEPTPAADCAPTVGRCGSLSLPATVRIVDDGETIELEPGVTTPLSSGGSLHLASAVVSPVRDQRCDPTFSYLESFSLAARSEGATP